MEQKRTVIIWVKNKHWTWYCYKFFFSVSVLLGHYIIIHSKWPLRLLGIENERRRRRPRKRKSPINIIITKERILATAPAASSTTRNRTIKTERTTHSEEEESLRSSSFGIDRDGFWASEKRSTIINPRPVYVWY